MDNEIDRYLSRCLKNWAANQQAAPPAREELLRKAAAAPRWQEPSYFRTSTIVHEFSNNRMVGYYTGEWLRGSFTLSLAWPTQLATLVQLSC